MKNIFSDSGIMASTNINNQSITTSSLTLNGGTKGDILMIADNNGTVDGLALGVTNHILVSNPLNNGLPGYTDAPSINTLTCNDLKINGLQTGDLIVGKTNDFVERLPIGVSGNILTSDGTNVLWNPIVLPDPLQIQDLELTQSLKLGWGQGTVFVDGNNNVFMERSQFNNNLSSIIIPYNTQITVSTFSIQISQNHSYQLTLNFGSAPNGNETIYDLKIFGNTIRLWKTISTELQTVVYSFTAPSTGNVIVELLGEVALPIDATSNAYNFYWSLLPLGILS